MVEEKNTSYLMIVSIVAIVAIVSLVIMGVSNRLTSERDPIFSTDFSGQAVSARAGISVSSCDCHAEFSPEYSVCSCDDRTHSKFKKFSPITSQADCTSTCQTFCKCDTTNIR